MKYHTHKHKHTHTHTHTLAKRLECSPLARETWVQSQVESYQRLKKWYLMPPCLTLSIIRYGSRVKWSNPGKGVAPSPTPWCSKVSKREPSGHPRLWSPTLLTFIYIYNFCIHVLFTYQICLQCSFHLFSLFSDVVPSVSLPNVSESGIVVPVRVSSMNQEDLFGNYSY